MCKQSICVTALVQTGRGEPPPSVWLRRSVGRCVSPGVLQRLVTSEALLRVLLHEAADEIFGCGGAGKGQVQQNAHYYSATTNKDRFAYSYTLFSLKLLIS